MIETERLILRPWRDADRAPFHAMSRSPAVMRHLGGVMDTPRTDAAIARVRDFEARYGYGFWALERLVDGAFLGFCGLKHVPVLGSPIDDEIEIGWRLREDAWGQGYAKEAALASLAWGWQHIETDRIVAMTVTGNTASWGLMERIGMVRRSDLDFDHPSFGHGHPLRRHITYVAERSRQD